MRFHSIQFDSRSLKISGDCARRIDKTLVFQLDGGVTKSFLDECRKELIECVKVYGANEERPNIFRGPYRLTERFGILTLIKIART